MSALHGPLGSVFGIGQRIEEAKKLLDLRHLECTVNTLGDPYQGEKRPSFW